MMHRAAAFLLLPLTLLAAAKLTEEQRLELIRGLTAEYATAKVLLPRSRKPLEFHSNGQFDAKKWADEARTQGPAARSGDLLQITKVSIENNKILLEINHGAKDKKKWYERVEVGMGGSGQTTPIGRDQNSTLATGTYLVIDFGEPLPALQTAEVKKMLAPVMDFEKRSATETFVSTLPPEMQQAVKENRALEGMDRDTVILAIGKPRSKQRETKEGLELEDWIYGQAPGKITFVTFNGNKVVKVKDVYAGLGGSTVPTPQQ